MRLSVPRPGGADRFRRNRAQRQKTRQGASPRRLLVSAFKDKTIFAAKDFVLLVYSLLPSCFALETANAVPHNKEGFFQQVRTFYNLGHLLVTVLYSLASPLVMKSKHQ